ncbi:MAG: Gfo/Idh/MocA family oxidoreductase [Kiritimatiellae bacterium]|nr:Gfo/Idh/MocA family oxidoreductase [Kiritimatiellia bacterium]
MKKDIGVGVIGVGMGENMLALNTNPHSRMEVRAVCSGTRKRVDEIAAGYGIAFATTDYRALIRRKDIDVVGIYSPDHLHYEHAAYALRHGKQVVLTKPMVTSLEQAKKLVKLVDKTGKLLLVGQTMRFDTEFLTLKKWQADGDLGTINFADAHYIHDMRPIGAFTPWRIAAPQDWMYGGACHPIDALRWFVGDVEEVHCYAQKSGMVDGYPLADDYLLNLRFKNGGIGRVLAAYGLVHPPIPMMEIRLFGTQASVRADYTDMQGGAIEAVFDKTPGHRPFRAQVDPVHTGAYGHGEGVDKYMAHFEECLLKNKPPNPDVRDGAKSIAVGAAAWQSAETGKPVRVFNEF